MDEPDITRTYSPKDMEFVEDRFEVVLPDDGASLTVIVTSEGIIMDAYKNLPVHDKGAVVPIPKGRYVSEHRGTIGMTFDEWWDFLANGRFSGV